MNEVASTKSEGQIYAEIEEMVSKIIDLKGRLTRKPLIDGVAELLEQLDGNGKSLLPMFEMTEDSEKDAARHIHNFLIEEQKKDKKFEGNSANKFKGIVATTLKKNIDKKQIDRILKGNPDKFASSGEGVSVKWKAK